MTNRRGKSKGETQVELADGSPQSNDDVLVWSSLSYPYTLRVITSRYNPKKIGEYADGNWDKADAVLKPGPNRVPKEIWDAHKDNPNVVKRLDLNVLSVGKEPKREISRQLAAYQAGNAMSAVEVIDIHSEVTHAPETRFEQQVRQQGNIPIVGKASNAATAALGAPIVAGG